MSTKHVKCPVGKRIREARQAAGLTQKALGIKAGIDEASSSSRINQYESGKHVPDFSTARLLSKVLKVPTAYFYAESDRLAELVRRIGSMDIIEQEALVDTIRKVDQQGA